MDHAEPRSPEAVIAEVVTWWLELRQQAGEHAAEEEIRRWFSSLPETQNVSEETLVLLGCEVADRWAEMGQLDSTFTVLRWLADLADDLTDTGTVWKLVMATTDKYVAYGQREVSALDGAMAGVSHLVATVRPRQDPRLRDALDRASAYIDYLQARRAQQDVDGWGRQRSRWRRLVRRWHRSGNPSVGLLVTSALWEEGQLLLGRDRLWRARRRFARAVTHGTRIASAKPSAIDEVPNLRPRLAATMACVRHSRDVLDRLDLPGPELETDYLRMEAREHRRWVVRMRGLPLVLGAPWLGGRRRHYRRSLQRLARSVHRRSARDVRWAATCAMPFVLLLRNFSLTEQSGTTTIFGEPTHGMAISTSSGSSVLQELDAAVRMVEVANTQAGLLELNPPWKLHHSIFQGGSRLYLPSDGWLETVGQLAALAETIVVWASSLSPGLEEELVMLRRRGRWADTVVLVQEDGSDPVIRAIFPRAAYDPLTRDHPALTGCRAVVVLTSDRPALRDYPELLQLVEHIDEVGLLPMEARVERMRPRLGISAR